MFNLLSRTLLKISGMHVMHVPAGMEFHCGNTCNIHMYCILAVFWSIVEEDQRIFTFFVHSFNHIKSFCTKVEQYCATLLLCRETRDMFIASSQQCTSRVERTVKSCVLCVSAIITTFFFAQSQPVSHSISSDHAQLHG